MRILITGATGFLGGYLIQECLNQGHSIIAFGRNDKVGQQLQGEKVTFVKGDFTKKEELERAFQMGIDQVVHAGALSTVWGKWQDFYQANVLGTQHVLDLCQKYPVERLVFVSSPSIYAKAENQNLVRENQVPAENHLSYYIESKMMAEKMVIRSSVPYVIIRPRGLFGVGDTSIIPRLLGIHDKIGIPLIHQGQHLVDVTCVENVAYAIRLMLDKEVALGQVYNITNDEPMTFKHLLDLFFKEMAIQGKYISVPKWVMACAAHTIEMTYKLLHIYKEPKLTKYTYYLLTYSQTLSVQKAKSELGYKPIMTIEEGIHHYVKSQKN
ncbi:NAD-dependent epimerase/dehydratase family protein [Streptococcus dentiloxodontae]